MIVDVTYLPGTVKAPQHTELTQAAFVETSNVHFPDGRLRTAPPYVQTIITHDYIDMTGGLRSIFAVKRSGSFAGLYYLFGTHTRLYAILNGTLYNMTPLRTSGTTLGSNPLSVSSGDATLTVAYTSHGFAVGDRIKISGATDTGGVTASTHINIEHIVATVPGVNSFTVELLTNAGSTASGGGASVVVYSPIAAGNLDQGAASGFGTGLYGSGLYGYGGAAVAAQDYPRIWSFASLGDDIVMCPGDYETGDGQKIYIWDGNTASAPTVLTNAPTDCQWVTVINNAVVALCGNTIKISEVGDGTVWSGATYYSKTLERVWKAVSCAPSGDKAGLIFTPGEEVILLRYVGGTDLWDIADLMTSDGILAPNAWASMESTVYWMGARGRVYRFNGSSVESVPNSQNGEWISNQMNTGQSWKSFAMADTDYNQIWFFFPTDTDDEPCDYAIFNIEGGHFTLGQMDRTAAQRPGFLDGVYYMGFGDSAATECAIYKHFLNTKPTFDWYAETAYAYAGDGSRRMKVAGFIPDDEQSGDISVTLYAKEYPKGAEYSAGPYTAGSSTTHITTKLAGKIRKIRFSGSACSATIGAWKEQIHLMGGR